MGVCYVTGKNLQPKMREYILWVEDKLDYYGIG
jgi:hypothetical protein